MALIPIAPCKGAKRMMIDKLQVKDNQNTMSLRVTGSIIFCNVPWITTWKSIYAPRILNTIEI